MKGFFTKEEGKFDTSVRATEILDHILNETSEITQEQRAHQVSVEDELRRERLVNDTSARVRSRVLFLTKDKKVLENGSAAQTHFKNLTEVFDEVHVIVLGLGRRKTETMRIASKAWVYAATSRYFLKQPFVASVIARQQLKFTDGFRADIIVALDPFESGLAGYFIARKFKRAFQVQITEDFYTDHFKEENEYSTWRLRFSRFVLKRTQSVRIDTDTLKQKLTTRYKNITDLALLPQYFNIKEIVQLAESNQTEKLYPQFSFVILYIGELDHDSTLFRAIDAVRPLLRTPSIGFIVIGDGPAKEDFHERARLLSVDTQVMFKPKTDDVVAHMRSADVLICTDTDSESESVVIKAAAAGLPVIMARTTLRDDLFTDGEDSFVCEAEDTTEFSQKLVKFLNTNVLRSQFSKNAKDIVSNRIAEDPEMYRIALRDSIEAVLYIEESARSEEELKKKTAQKDVKRGKQKDVVGRSTLTILPESKYSSKKEISGIEMNMPKE